jgi:heat shock protein HtpX
VAIMTLASFFASIASMITQFGFFFGGGSSDDDDGPSWIFVVLISLAVYVISFLLMQALSRYREFAADRGAAVITGRPSALASALLKISGINERIPTQDLRVASQMQAFYISPVGRHVAGLFATHPPIEKRVAALERLESQLQGTPLATAA